MLTGPQVASLVDTAKAGTMAAAPSEDDVQMVLEVLGAGTLSRDQAFLLLKKNNNDLPRALSAWYDDPNDALREEPAARQWEPQDNIPYDVDANMPALSRPPSRADDNEKRVIDLSANHAAAQPRTQQEHDADLQKAIELSKQDAYGEQENGITYTGGHFGPANRSHYDPAQWAVAAPYSSSREITEQPPPQQRQRNPGEPAFLRGQSSTGYLGPLLTIYHSIPIAREAMLFPPMGVLAYGHDPHWWCGHSDENTKSLSVQDPERSDRDTHNLLAEIQCLMAFLDNSKRAYGSVDALADLLAYKASPGHSEISKLLAAWKGAAVRQVPDEALTQIFSLEARKNYGNSQPHEKTLNCLEPYVQRADNALLIELLDKTVWNDTADAVDDIWMEYIPEVLTIHLADPKKEKLPLGVAPPTTLYPDRYLYEFREQSQHMRREIQVLRRRIDKYTKTQQNCEVIQTPDRRSLKVRDVLLAAANAIPVATSQVDVAAIDEDSAKAPAISQSSIQKLDADIRDMLRKLDAQMNRLEAKKAEIKEQMRKLTLQMTQPNPNPFESSPKHKYVLQGVSTKPDVTHVRRRNLDLIDIDPDEGDSFSEWQWWRMSWSKDDIQPGGSTVIGPLTEAQAKAANQPQGVGLSYSIKKVKEEEVLEAAQTEHNSVLLVYANDRAMSLTPSTLSMPLRKFVEQDNRQFDNELREAGVGQHRASISHQTDSTIFEDVSFIGNNNPSAHVREIQREMTPMSMASPSRDADGQPSPKRPKSSEEDWDPNTTIDSPPAYDEVVSSSPSPQEMKEKNKGKIGMYAEQLLEKYGGGEGAEKGG